MHKKKKKIDKEKKYLNKTIINRKKCTKINTRYNNENIINV